MKNSVFQVAEFSLRFAEGDLKFGVSDPSAKCHCNEVSFFLCMRAVLQVSQLNIHLSHRKQNALSHQLLESNASHHFITAQIISVNMLQKICNLIFLTGKNYLAVFKGLTAKTDGLHGGSLQFYEDNPLVPYKAMFFCELFVIRLDLCMFEQ